ncbi:flagellar basal body L-ring protein FlgH [bacterium]|nr:flagellar basal body L-ring protein FlgH [bacterium]
MKKFIFPILLLLFPHEGVAKSKSKHVEKDAKRIEETSPNRESYYDSDLASMKQKVKENKSGSLWMDAYSSRLYDNMYRAAKIGDTVMIIIEEQAQAKNNGTTKANKKTEQDNSISQLGGLMAKLSQIVKLVDPTQLIGAKSESKFQGDGSTQRAGSLSAKISAEVVDVLHNGNMVIRGEQHIKVNKEEQVLIVEGIIRPYDIKPDNTVLSSSIADARISYNGFGVVAEKQSPGWLVRALDMIWPF